MASLGCMSPTDIRHQFSIAMSSIYKAEVPLYSDLIDLVRGINKSVLDSDASQYSYLSTSDQISRLSYERHGAIRLASDEEMITMARFLKVMGMFPVGYYDLSTASLPVHSTCFRPVDLASLNTNPFRLFVSLLRPALVSSHLRPRIAALASRRCIFHPRTLELISVAEASGGLTPPQAAEFIATGLETFKWRSTATTSLVEYRALHSESPLLADVVAFAGPHINHLTPRTLDIDALQHTGRCRGIPMKEVIEGPPRRKCPILLRQTSFKALEEAVIFIDGGDRVPGSHTARFGEVEQRGAALTPKGRQLYDELVVEAARRGISAADEPAYSKLFARFPESWEEMRRLDLCWFNYRVADDVADEQPSGCDGEDRGHTSVEELIRQGLIQYEPLVYEDFLPLSAAGIFQSNLEKSNGAGQAVGAKRGLHSAGPNAACREELVEAVGGTIFDEMELYAAMQEESLEQCRRHFGIRA